MTWMSLAWIFRLGSLERFHFESFELWGRAESAQRSPAAPLPTRTESIVHNGWKSSLALGQGTLDRPHGLLSYHLSRSKTRHRLLSKFLQF